MKKYLILTTILYTAIISSIFGQCPPDDVQLETQQDINDFPSLYPDCTEILGDLRIGMVGGGGFISDLSPLSQITSVAADFTILYSSLGSLNGFENITFIGGDLNIYHNSYLANLTGLDNLTFIGGGIDIYRNGNLMSLTGLDNLTSVGEDLLIERNHDIISLIELDNLTSVGGNLEIVNNDGLINLTGLENITSVMGIVIADNRNLINLDALNSNITSLEGKLEIADNLTLNSLNSLNNLTSVGENLEIVNNDDLINLTGLENITSIGRSLIVSHNDNLVSLAALNNITSIGGLRISGNETLSNLDGLNNISSVNGIHIADNNNLVDLGALSNIPTSLVGSLYISGNGVLTNLDVFSGLVSTGGTVLIYGNNNLEALTGLSNLTSIGGSLEIGSSALSTLNGLENLKSIGSSLYISNNENLVDLTALSNLTLLGDWGSLHIKNNTSLESLSGLDNIISIADSSFIYGNPNLSVCHVESVCNYIIESNGYYVADNATGCNNGAEIIENCASVWEGYVQGKIYFDENTNCQQDPDEPDVNDWLIKIEGEGIIEYAYPYGGGNYIQPLGPGIYMVTAIPPNSLWEEVCQSQTTVQLTDQNPTDIIDFGGSTSTFCPFLEIDVTTPFIRRCFNSQYHVRYCNSGTATAENAFVEVQLDPFFTFVDATIEEVDLGENLYSFDLGNIDVGECSDFQIEVYVDCDSTVLGQTHCVEAHIFPDSTCIPIDPLWDESSIMVNAECLGDSIEFTISNVGIGDMSDSLEYMVVEEDLIWHKAKFKLDSDDDFKFSKPANGEYHRIEAQQSVGHPGNSMPSIFVEGCGEDDNGEFSLGFVNYYVLDEGNAFVSIDCQENVGAYDPNDKQAFPVGVGDQHYITNYTDLEYMIRFQNTGTDMAFTVVVRDTISPHLNIETLRPGVASHPYTFDIDNSDVAVFTFDNIMLPDSNVNEAASHGFIKFKIEQQTNNPVGTTLENEASIYFDFNEPIITNVVTHTIHEDYFTNNVSVVTQPEVDEAGISVNVFPNPFDRYTIFEIQGGTVSELHLTVYDIMGREVVQKQNANQSFIGLNRKNLSPGIYVFRLMDEKQQLATGKLVIK